MFNRLNKLKFHLWALAQWFRDIEWRCRLLKIVQKLATCFPHLIDDLRTVKPKFVCQPCYGDYARWFVTTYSVVLITNWRSSTGWVCMFFIDCDLAPRNKFLQYFPRLSKTVFRLKKSLDFKFIPLFCTADAPPHNPTQEKKFTCKAVIHSRRTPISDSGVQPADQFSQEQMFPRPILFFKSNNQREN